MQAILQDRYGSPDHLRLVDVDQPTPADDQVLVRVRAASLNAGDWRRVRGAPFLVRTSNGWRRPEDPGVATDAAGEVEAVGRDVTELKPGDRVFGIRLGACAEYVAGANFVRMPANLSFEQAAAIPVAGITALQGVRDHASVRPGERVLVNGAGGGVGSFLVQIAKAHGAEVTAVSSADHAETLRSTGADHVVDYGTEDFTRSDLRYDVILDVGGNRSLRDIRRVLAPDGRIVLIGAGKGMFGPMGRFVGGIIRQRLLKERLVVFIAKVSLDDLARLGEMAEAGQLTPVIDSTWPLAETPAAFHRLETTHARGKIVITF
jgi:NADPH:quinone reductase-like Zn-dependent oxidoreductase